MASLVFSNNAATVRTASPDISSLEDYVVFWPLNGDFAGLNGNDLTNEVLAEFVPGLFDQAVQLISVDTQYLYAGSTEQLQYTLGSDMTWMGWVKTSSTDTVLLSKTGFGGAAGVEYQMSLVAGHGVWSTSDGATLRDAVGSINIADNQWHLIRLDYDITAETSHIYVDQTLDGSYHIAPQPQVANADFYFGLLQDLDAKLQAWGRWDRIITPTEWARYYNNGLGVQMSIP